MVVAPVRVSKARRVLGKRSHQQQLMGKFAGDCAGRHGQGRERGFDCLLLAEVGEQRCFFAGGAGLDVRLDRCAEFGDAFAG